MVRVPQLSANPIYPAKSFNGNLNFASNPTKQQCSSLLKSKAVLRFRALSRLHFATDSKTCVPSSWNSLIRGFARSKGESQREAIWAFIAMRRSEARPNELTYPFLFKACTALLALEEGRQVQSDVLKRVRSSDMKQHEDNLAREMSSSARFMQKCGNRYNSCPCSRQVKESQTID
ncbi:hypothetical protein RJ639_030194 [Escallonia herrerae]|uniref:Pentatricopeptide repeat-containing protein n=1 Tax=Escallonia herrerae TaxID=1293975 RepID=A0AA88X6Q9_9ASTE|nr:hypothetical protein RJ639_030194 [Escallonia herrerae]